MQCRSSNPSGVERGAAAELDTCPEAPRHGGNGETQGGPQDQEHLQARTEIVEGVCLGLNGLHPGRQASALRHRQLVQHRNTREELRKPCVVQFLEHNCTGILTPHGMLTTRCRVDRIVSLFNGQATPPLTAVKLESCPAEIPDVDSTVVFCPASERATAWVVVTSTTGQVASLNLDKESMSRINSCSLPRFTQYESKARALRPRAVHQLGSRA